MNGFDIPNNINLSSPEATKQIWSYVLSMQEQIEYWLRNLDAQNFNDAGLKEIAGMFKADTIISNTNITQEIYADYGNIADLTVDKLRTDYTKAQKYLKGDTSDVNYLYIHDETISFITATVGSGTEQLTDGDRVFYWTDETHTQMTSEKVTDYPVMIYKYTELVKMKFFFYSYTESGTKYYVPAVKFGAGSDSSGNNDVCVMYKRAGAMCVDYTTAAGKLVTLRLSDYVDADMRRISSAEINKGAGTISVLAEGETSATTLSYTETDTSMTFTWPDGHTAAISIS